MKDLVIRIDDKFTDIQRKDIAIAIRAYAKLNYIRFKSCKFNKDEKRITITEISDEAQKNIAGFVEQQMGCELQYHEKFSKYWLSPLPDKKPTLKKCAQYLQNLQKQQDQYYEFLLYKHNYDIQALDGNVKVICTPHELEHFKKFGVHNEKTNYVARTDKTFAQPALKVLTAESIDNTEGLVLFQEVDGEKVYVSKSLERAAQNAKERHQKGIGEEKLKNIKPVRAEKSIISSSRIIRNVRLPTPSNAKVMEEREKALTEQARKGEEERNRLLQDLKNNAAQNNMAVSGEYRMSQEEQDRLNEQYQAQQGLMESIILQQAQETGQPSVPKDEVVPEKEFDESSKLANLPAISSEINDSKKIVSPIPTRPSANITTEIDPSFMASTLFDKATPNPLPPVLEETEEDLRKSIFNKQNLLPTEPLKSTIVFPGDTRQLNKKTSEGTYSHRPNSEQLPAIDLFKTIEHGRVPFNANKDAQKAIDLEEEAKRIQQDEKRIAKEQAELKQKEEELKRLEKEEAQRLAAEREELEQQKRLEEEAIESQRRLEAEADERRRNEGQPKPQDPLVEGFRNPFNRYKADPQAEIEANEGINELAAVMLGGQNNPNNRQPARPVQQPAAKYSLFSFKNIALGTAAISVLGAACVGISYYTAGKPEFVKSIADFCKGLFNKAIEAKDSFFAKIDTRARLCCKLF